MKKKTLVIFKVKNGFKKKTGSYWFVLKGRNAKVICTSEMYTQKRNIIKVHKNNFPDFEVVDTTINSK